MGYKLRIKHPSGAEFEAEGPEDFVLNEKERFLSRLSTTGEAAPDHPDTAKTPDWEALTTARDGITFLKHKHPGLKAGEAALLILAAESQLNNNRKITAILLSKAVKASGYAPARLDRILTGFIRETQIKASGTKRNRAYHITDKGLETAWLAARRLES